MPNAAISPRAPEPKPAGHVFREDWYAWQRCWCHNTPLPELYRAQQEARRNDG